MISKEGKHQKHASLRRPALGEFGRYEFAFLGAPCSVIKQLFEQIILSLPEYKIAVVDADHHTPEAGISASMQFTDRITYRNLSYQQNFNLFQNRMLFNEQDLVLVNGNHFKAKSQVVIVDPAKPLEQKLDKLTDVKLILLKDEQTEIPGYLTEYFKSQSINLTMGLKSITHKATEAGAIPILNLHQTELIAAFIKDFLQANQPPLYGLVLAGGNSLRMQTDKGSIDYHGKSQREYAFEQLKGLCEHVFVSARNEQQVEEGLTVIADRFEGLGPFGGILSALQSNPDAAWLTIACDLPYLTENTLTYLVRQRNPSKIATAFLDSDGKFPEPLITIWEPRSYPILLQFLSQGYSCPRKVLINSDIELLNAPNTLDFRNVNHPEEKEEALQYFKNNTK